MNRLQMIFLFVIELPLIWILLPANAQVEEWKIACGAKYTPKSCGNFSLEELENVEDFERCGPALLDPISRDYVWRGAGSEITLWENKKAFRKIRIKKRVLRGLFNHSLETTVMGGKLDFPVGISPTAGQIFYHPEGELGMGRGAAKAGALMILNSLALTSLEVVAAAVPPETQLWFQTYIDEDREEVKSLVRRAERAGYNAIVVTVDESLEVNLRCGGRTKFSIKYRKDLKYPNKVARKYKVDPKVNFHDLKWLTNMTTLPVIAKGVLTKEDALLAIEAGVSGIFVSNHGGRELDGSSPTIVVLPEIVDAVNSVNPEIEVYVDGGIRSGYDVFKALALGAKAAFIGRPPIWGLALGGGEGVAKLLNIIKQEFRLAMVHAGFRSPSEITRSSLLLPTIGYADASMQIAKREISEDMAISNFS